jgi:hypothetical protein
MAPAPSVNRNVVSNTLPPYKKPSHPLDANAQMKLRDIYNHAAAKSLKDHQEMAIKVITDAAGKNYDQLREREQRVVRRRKKWEKGENLEQQDEEEQGLREMQDKVEEATKKLEESMRSMIDAGEAAQRIQDTLTWLRETAPGHIRQQYETQLTQRQSQVHSQSQRRRTQRDNEDEDMDSGGEEGPTPGPTPLTQARIAINGPSDLFQDRMEKKKNEYLSFSHTARYSKNNAYIGFKSMVHDAKYGDDGPPLPHPDNWFTESGSPAPGITATEGDDDDDDDIVVDKATVSTRCPITFQRFQEPFSSKKCPHSFEKTAILDMIRRSNTRVGIGARGEKAIQCPVSGCDQVSIVMYCVAVVPKSLTCLHRSSLRMISMKTLSLSARSNACKLQKLGPPRTAIWRMGMMSRHRDVLKSTALVMMMCVCLPLRNRQEAGKQSCSRARPVRSSNTLKYRNDAACLRG